MTKRTAPFSPEVRERAVRMVREHEGEHGSQWSAIQSIAAKIGCSGETLRNWVRQSERDQGVRPGQTTDERERIKALEREVRELRQANEILRKASAYFAMAELDAGLGHDQLHRRSSRGLRGRADLQGAADRPSTYYVHAARRADPDKQPVRARSDAALMIEIQRVFEANFCVYGVRKIWRQLAREGIVTARCTVARLMRKMGLAGVVRGRTVRTTIPDPAAACPLDRINRQFKAPRPNALWVSDFTYVATWSGFVYVAFVIDVFARRIVGWRASRSAHASFVLDALEQALHERRPVQGSGLVHHSDRGSQYLALRYTERLVGAGIEPSVGSVGDSYDNALAETINGLFKAEVIHRRGPWRSVIAVEYATLEWVDWYNHRRLLAPIGNVPPAEAEARYHANVGDQPMAA